MEVLREGEAATERPLDIKRGGGRKSRRNLELPVASSWQAPEETGEVNQGGEAKVLRKWTQE